MRKWFEEKGAEKPSALPTKSLADLMSTTPHLRSSSFRELVSSGKTLELNSEALLEALEAPEWSSHPLSYLPPDQLDNYYDDLDETRDETQAPKSPLNRAVEAAIGNPHSVYNWLRKHEPKIFLQDGESSELSNGKPGSLRGAGKRAPMPVPSKADALEIVEEDGIGYDPTLSGLEPPKAGKRKRDKEDDVGYHPKLGAPDGKLKRPRPKKKKTVEGSESTASGTPKAKKTKTANNSKSSEDTVVKEEPEPSESGV